MDYGCHRRLGDRCPVPGLADMAQPPLVDVGLKEGDERRAAFWYRRTFTLAGPVPAVATLKVHKAMFTTRVYLNGKLVQLAKSFDTP